jgi:cytochrome c oxidase assembly factor CtaG
VWTAAAGSVAGWMGAGALWIFVDVVRFASRTASSRSGEAIWPRFRVCLFCRGEKAAESFA